MTAPDLFFANKHDTSRDCQRVGGIEPLRGVVDVAVFRVLDNAADLVVRLVCARGGFDALPDSLTVQESAEFGCFSAGKNLQSPLST